MNSNFYNSPYIDEDFVRGIQYINPQYSAGFYSTRLLKEAKPEIVSEVIMGQIISVTGYNHEKDLIEDSLRQLGGIIGDKDIWQEEQFIVIGRFAYDENYLKESISLGLYIEKPFNYISFEDFLFYMVFGQFSGYRYNYHRILHHPALHFLASIGFKWPSTHGSQGGGGTLDPNWNTKSILASRYGYTVRAGVSERKRREALRSALSGKYGLTLQSVVEHIAFLVRINKGRYDSSMENAIEKWELDMDWLYNEYYKGSIFSFAWPIC